jgi:3-oxoadipate enol-lactonase
MLLIPSLRLFIVFIALTTLLEVKSYARSGGKRTLTISSVESKKSNPALRIDSGYSGVNGTKLYWETAGIGETIVLIHGSFGDRRFWDFQFAALSKKYKVLRYDVRGYGKSALPKSEEPYTDAEDLNALMESLKIKKAHICGLSLGSIVGIDFALAHPDKLISLILCGPRVAGDGTDEYRTINADTVRAIIAKTTDIVKNQSTKEATDYLWTGNHSMGKTVISSITREKLLNMGYEYSWWRYLHTSKRGLLFPMAIKKLYEIKIPTLIITAEYDLELCKEVAAIILKEIAGAKLISVKGAGHIMNMDKPGKFNKELFKFIRNLE